MMGSWGPNWDGGKRGESSSVQRLPFPEPRFSCCLSLLGVCCHLVATDRKRTQWTGALPSSGQALTERLLVVHPLGTGVQR